MHRRRGQPGRTSSPGHAQLTRCADRPIFEDLGGGLVRRKEAFDAQLLHGHILRRAERGDGSEQTQRCLPLAEVSRLTTVALLRVRYLLHQPERAPLLSEEVVVAACTDAGTPGAAQWLADPEALRLLADAKPDAEVPMAEKRALVAAALEAWPTLESALRDQIKRRAAELETSHKRVRQAVSLRVRELTVTPQLPPDLLGLLVLQPEV
jgi:hypothetical protein